VQPAASIFKAYDIRGIVGETLTEPVVESIGLALGMMMAQAGKLACVVGRDGRHSGPALVDALAKGLMASGIDVIDVGQVPTPVVYFGTVSTGCVSLPDFTCRSNRSRTSAKTLRAVVSLASIQNQSPR